MGRRSKLTPQVQETIIGAITLGATFRHAAQLGGISEQTFYSWLEQGRAQTRGKKREFLEAVTRAESRGLMENLALIRQAAQGRDGTADRIEVCPECDGDGKVPGQVKDLIKCKRCKGKGEVKVKGSPAIPADWKAAAFVVERRFPHEYGRQVIEQQDPSDESMHLTPEQLKSKRAELTRRLINEGAGDLLDDTDSDT